MANIVLSTPGAQRQGAVNNRVERAENQSSFLAAEGLAKLSEAVGALEQRRQGLKAKEDAAQMQADLSVWLEKRKASGNPEEIGKDFIEEKNKKLNGYKEKSDSMYYRRALDEAGVSVFASLIGPVEEAKITAEFRDEEKRIQGIIDNKNTYVMTRPDAWKETSIEVAADISAAILPAETKAAMIKKAKHNFAYTSALTDLQVNPVRLKQDLESGKYDGAFSAEEQFNYLSGAENNIFKALLAGDTVEAEKYVRENKFTTIPEKAALDKIAAKRKANEKAVLEQDKLNRALFELNFWNDPSWGKLEAFDFRGDEKKKEKWEERLRQIPNPDARTTISSVDDLASGISGLASMPYGTDEEKGKVFEEAAKLTSAVFRMNKDGILDMGDMRNYTSSIGQIVTNGVMFDDFKKMFPDIERFKKDISAMRASAVNLPVRERSGYVASLGGTEKNAREAQRILQNGFGSFVREIAAGNKDTANLIYKDTLIAARNAMYPFLAGKQKGDAVVDDNGTVMVLAGFDGITPIVEGK